MNQLVACITNDSGKPHVEKLVNSFNWDNVIFITDETMLPIKYHKKHAIITVDLKNKSEQVSEELKKELKKHVTGFEIGVNLFSGNGKLHMAAMAALLKIGTGIRLVVIAPEGVKEL